MRIAILTFSEICQLSVIAGEQLVFTERLNYSNDLLDQIYSKLDGFDINQLNLMVKSSVVSGCNAESVPISSFTIGSIKKYSAVSLHDLDGIKYLCMKLNIKTFKLFDYFGYYKLLKDSGKYIVVDTNFDNMVSCVYINNGIVGDYRLCRYEMLENVLKSLVTMYDCEEVITLADVKNIKLNVKVGNIDLLQDEYVKTAIAPAISTLHIDNCVTIEVNSEDYQDNEYFEEIASSTSLTEDIFEQEEIPVKSKVKEKKAQNIPKKVKVQKEHSENKIISLSSILVLVTILLISLISAIIYSKLPALSEKNNKELTKLERYSNYLYDESAYIDRLQESYSNYDISLFAFNEKIKSVPVNGIVSQITYYTRSVELDILVKDPKAIDDYKPNLEKVIHIDSIVNEGKINLKDGEFFKYHVICKSQP